VTGEGRLDGQDRFQCPENSPGTDEHCPGCGRPVPAGADGHARHCPWDRSGGNPDADEVAVHQVLARFIAWLTRHEVAPDRRRQYHDRVEQYLRWRTGDPDPHADRTQWRYLNLLSRRGADEHELALVRTSLSLLSRHMVTADRAAWPRPGG
jgi:hypothetical protein